MLLWRDVDGLYSYCRPGGILKLYVLVLEEKRGGMCRRGARFLLEKNEAISLVNTIWHYLWCVRNGSILGDFNLNNLDYLE